jgi:hypothetical protein
MKSMAAFFTASPHRIIPQTLYFDGRCDLAVPPFRPDASDELAPSHDPSGNAAV